MLYCKYLAGLLSLTYFTISLPAYAASINIYPGNSFETAVESLNPGDTLIVHQGTYSDSGRISITVKGTSTSPVVIQGAVGETRPTITRPPSAAQQNTINIEGASYLTIQGLEIVGNGGAGITLVSSNYTTLEDLVIHDIDLGIHISNTMNNITVRKNHIYNTGIGGGTGEGMYVGCNYATCIVSDSIIENNWIRDNLPGTTQGDGIEVKTGSYNIVVRNNVIYNMGLNTGYPGIFVYGGGNGINTVEGNAVWNCGEGIYAVSDAIVRNNIVLNSWSGLSLYSHSQVGPMKNLTIVNNTLYNNTNGLYIRWGGSEPNVTLANNAVYSLGKLAVDTNWGISAGISVLSNYIEGTTTGVGIDNTRFFSGGSSVNAFVDAPNKNFWPKPGSILIGKGATSPTPNKDFNENLRTQPFDVGAYETDGLSSNPGWNVGPGFKPSAGAPKDTIPPKAPASLRVQ